MNDVDSKQQLLAALLASGFPFQTAIADLVAEVPGCGIVAQEFPWKDEAGSDGFIDLIASCAHFNVVIECKKTNKDTLIFLQPTTPLHSNVNRARCAYVSQIQDSTMRMDFFCGDWHSTPESPEAAFCVVSTSSTGKDQRMLEKYRRTFYGVPGRQKLANPF